VSSSALAHKDGGGLLPGGKVVKGGFIDNETKK